MVKPPAEAAHPAVSQRIESRILTVRSVKVIIDADLAELYGVPTKRLNEQVKRNLGRFPSDFMFQLTATEKTEVVANCDHLVRLKFAKAMPFAFTEFGAIQAANVLNSPQAVEMGVYVVRAFMQLRELTIGHRDLSQRLGALEHRTESLALAHDTFSRNTRAQLKQVFDAVRELMSPPDPPKRPIGFVIDSKPDKKIEGKDKATSRRKSNSQKA